MSKTTVNTDYSHWYLYLISPFLAGLVALKNYRTSWAKNVLLAFIVFFGFTFGTAKEISGSASSDIFRYTEEVKTLYKINLSFDQIKKLYRENKDIDVLRLTIAIGLSRFTDNAKILTAIYGLIFGFFFTRNIWFILDRLEGKIKVVSLLLLISFFLVCPFWYINGFRFYTATLVFIYGLLPFLFEGNKRGIFFSSLSFLVHFSFLLPIAVLWTYVLLGNRTIIYFAFFLASIVSSEINIKAINTFIEARAPKAISERTSSYREDRQVKDFRSGKGKFDVTKGSLHALFYLKALRWSLVAFLVFLFFKRKTLVKMNKGLLNGLAFAILFWGVANFMSSIPSGSRYITIASLAALPVVIFYYHYQYEDKYFKKLVLLALPALALFMIVAMREGFYFLTINTIIGNPLVAMFADYDFVLNDWIK